MSLNSSTPHEPNYGLIINLIVAWFLCVFGIISNCLLLCVTIKCKGMFPTQQLLAIADLIFCFSYFTASPCLIYWEYNGMTDDEVSILLVLLYPWPHCCNVGFWWTSLLTLVLSFERFVASSFPIWYKRKWDTWKPKLITGVYAVMALMLVPGYAAYVKIYVERGTMMRFGGYYAIISNIPYLIVIQTNVGLVEAFLSAILTALALVLGKRKRTELGITLNENWVKIEKKMERTVLGVVTCTVLLIALPNLCLSLLNLIIESNYVTMPDWIYVARRYITFPMILNSALNFWLYIVFHSGFRVQARIRILGKGPSVSPGIDLPGRPRQQLQSNLSFCGVVPPSGMVEENRSLREFSM